MVIDSNPKVPDRTAAILGGGESPVPAMRAGIEALKRAGADFVVIPCVSAHFFLEELRREAGAADPVDVRRRGRTHPSASPAHP